MEEKSSKEIIAEQITQNYLLQPQDLFNSQEKASYSFVSLDMPKMEAISVNTYFQTEPLANLEKETKPYSVESKEVSSISKETKPYSVESKEVSSISKETSKIILNPSQGLSNTDKKLSTLEQNLVNNITPAISNLYKSVSSLLDKGKDPKGYTEARPTYNGINLYFDEEKKRVSMPVTW